MATLTIRNNFVLDSDGIETIGKQGSTTDAITDGYSLADSSITISGTAHSLKGILATATVRLLYDASVDFPATFDYGFIWTDTAGYLQLIGTATNLIIPIIAKVPLVFTASMLAAANTTAMSGSAPSVTAISKVYVQNNSGGNMNFRFAIID